jgi:hypothetical protein
MRFTLAVLITLLAVIVVFENWRGNRAWRNYLAEQEAKGEMLDWRKLVPPPVPDDQNFAKTPLLAKLTDYKYDPQTGQATFAESEGKARLEGMFAWTVPLKGEGAWRKTARTDWTQMQTSLRALTNSELPTIKALLARPAGKPADDILFLLAQNEAELNEIAAVRRLPRANFGVHYEEGIMALLPQLSVIKNFAHAIRLRSLAELEAGRSDAALADWQTISALGEALKGDPILITLLVRIAVQDMSHQVIWEGLAQQKWTDAQLQTIEERLAGINLVAEALAALRGERAFGMLAMDQLHRPGTTGFPKGDRDATVTPSFSYLPSGWVSQNKLTTARMYDRFIFGAFDHAKQRVDIKLARQYEREVDTTLGSGGPYTMMAKLLFPAISKAGLKVANAQTAIHLARVAVALERHRLAEGKYPADLTVLSPRFLPKLPVDLDEQPLRYQLESNGQFVLYSIGSDLVDDKGRIGKPDGKFSNDEGDWVWKYPAP